MGAFMDEDFLLGTKEARRLFHDHAEGRPIFDYHCHLSPRDIAENRRERDITEAWLAHDHYKWRVIRANGMDEREGDSFQKFLNWSDAVAHAVGNPLYHWTHLELRRYFGIEEPLSPATARGIYERCNSLLASDPALDAYGIFRKFGVYAVGTTDDPVDDLAFHRAAKGRTETRVMPSFRPDKAINIASPGFNAYIDRLQAVSGVTIERPCDVVDALGRRLDFFIENGALATDHSVPWTPYAEAGEARLDEIFSKVRAGGIPTADEAEAYSAYVLLSMAEVYHKRGVVMQIHMQASRNNNSRGFAALGPDSGYDALTDHSIALKLSRFLDFLDKRRVLPRTIFYSLNPADYPVILSLAGSFQGDVPGKIQLGSAWWFCDHIDGMAQQIRAVGNYGLLSRFVGMLTDSRSFLSYPRHEYFRRILCGILGSWMAEGLVPYDWSLMGKMVEDISFNNAKAYFGA